MQPLPVRKYTRRRRDVGLGPITDVTTSRKQDHPALVSPARAHNLAMFPSNHWLQPLCRCVNDIACSQQLEIEMSHREKGKADNTDNDISYLFAQLTICSSKGRRCLPFDDYNPNASILGYLILMRTILKKIEIALPILILSCFKRKLLKYVFL